MPDGIEVRAATGTAWTDVATLFTGRDDPASCWCQWFRLPSRDFDAAGVEQRCGRLQAEVEGPPPGPGVVALRDGEPVGWCGAEPTEGYPRLLRSPLLRGVEPASWAVTCFVVPPAHRRQGVARALLAGAVRHAREHGADAIDALPVDTAVRQRATAAELYHGPLRLFVDAGFIEIARPSPARAVVRLEPARPTSGAGAPG